VLIPLPFRRFGRFDHRTASRDGKLLLILGFLDLRC